MIKNVLHLSSVPIHSEIKIPQRNINSTIIDRRYGPEILRMYRKIEKCAFKYAKVNCDLEFLKTSKSKTY